MLELYVKVATAIVGGIVGLYTLYEKIIKPIRDSHVKQMQEHLKSHQEISSAILEMNEKITKLSNEILINGGNSTLRDKITFITDMLQSVKGEVDSGFYMSSIPRFIADSNGNFIAANPALCILFGATEKEMMGAGWSNYIVDEDRNDKFEYWVKAMQRDNVVFDSYIIRTTNDAIKHIVYKAVINKDANGRVLSAHGMCQEKIAKE